MTESDWLAMWGDDSPPQWPDIAVPANHKPEPMFPIDSMKQELVLA